MRCVKWGSDEYSLGVGEREIVVTIAPLLHSCYLLLLPGVENGNLVVLDTRKLKEPVFVKV